MALPRVNAKSCKVPRFACVLLIFLVIGARPAGAEREADTSETTAEGKGRGTLHNEVELELELEEGAEDKDTKRCWMSWPVCRNKYGASSFEIDDPSYDCLAIIDKKAMCLKEVIQHQHNEQYKNCPPKYQKKVPDMGFCLREKKIGTLGAENLNMLRTIRPNELSNLFNEPVDSFASPEEEAVDSFDLPEEEASGASLSEVGYEAGEDWQCKLNNNLCNYKYGVNEECLAFVDGKGDCVKKVELASAVPGQHGSCSDDDARKVMRMGVCYVDQKLRELHPRAEKEKDRLKKKEDRMIEQMFESAQGQRQAPVRAAQQVNQHQPKKATPTEGDGWWLSPKGDFIGID